MRAKKKKSVENIYSWGSFCSLVWKIVNNAGFVDAIGFFVFDKILTGTDCAINATVEWP